MSTVDEIKAAALKLPLEKKIELHHWLFESEDMQRWHHEQLKREIDLGVADEERGAVAPLDMNDIKSKAREIWNSRGH